LKRRIPLGKKRPEDSDVILGSYLVGKLREIDFHLPANVFPVLACVSELQRLRAFPAVGLSNPNSEDSGVDERKD
jgi:hypothetical protein